MRAEGRFLLIQWESYKLQTWYLISKEKGLLFCIYLCHRENANIIPSFIVDHYDRTGEKKLPLPRVKSTRKIGTTVQHMLVYEDDPSLDQWVPLSNYTDLGDTVSLSCKTEKDRDKRTHRYEPND